ncbi:MAG: hypothetical protein ACYCYP_11090 [Leptospirales bacterium]
MNSVASSPRGCIRFWTRVPRLRGRGRKLWTGSPSGVAFEGAFPGRKRTEPPERRPVSGRSGLSTLTFVRGEAVVVLLSVASPPIILFHPLA